MESQGTYQAGNPADESATPEKVVPLRRTGFTMFDNAYLDEAMADLSGAAWKCLSFLIRQTCGFQASHAAVSLSVFSDGIRRADGTMSTKGTGLTRPSVIAALDDLLRANIIQRIDDGKRTSIPHYALRPQEDWNLAALQGTHRRTSKKTLLADESGKKTLPIKPRTSKKTFQADASSLSSNFTHVNKGERKENQKKERSSDADAPTPRKRSSRPRKLSDEQYAAKQVEEEWMAAIFQGMEEINGYPVTGKGKERAAAHALYRYRGPKNRDAVLPVERVLDCYRTTLIDPFYATQQLSLHTILKVIGAYLNSPSNYRAGMEEKRRKAEYARNAANGRASTPKPTIPNTIAFEGD